jgi:hypothetical protein
MNCLESYPPLLKPIAKINQREKILHSVVARNSFRYSEILVDCLACLRVIIPFLGCIILLSRLSLSKYANSM